ncbi:MAG TPA: SseB family protein [Microbacteriaceae bacterium]|nr:SseB family protein [Microbacteriaceae bacterium]
MHDHDPAVDGHRYGSTDAHDSAGRPWSGRSFQPNPNADDDGAADPALLAALRAFHAGQAPRARVVDALRDARLLVPLLAEAGEIGFTEDGRRVDKTQELSLVTVQGPNGQPVLPAFTSVDTMRAWNAKARPIPAEARLVALAAGSDDSGVVIDPMSPTEFALRRPMLAALATAEPWVEPWDVDALWDAYQAFMEGEPDILAIDIGPVREGSTFLDPEVAIVLTVSHALPEGAAAALIDRADVVWRGVEAGFDGPAAAAVAVLRA